jgi:hypothetical protein
MGGTVGLMAIEIQTSMMQGGLDLATPPIVMPPGKVIAAINYEPDVAGYTSFGGFERFDGHPRPSDSTEAATIIARREAILPVPGTGPVRGVWVFDGAVYAFRDQTATQAGMFKSTAGGWVQQTFSYKLSFTAGETEILEDDLVTGVTSLAFATVDRVVLRSGTWAVAPDNTAEGYLIVHGVSGTFSAGEQITSSGGEATMVAIEAVALLAGGQYEFTNHNFYGAAERTRMYFVNGVDTAFEWTGTSLNPIFTGVTSGDSTEVDLLLMPEAPIALGETLLSGGASPGDSIVMAAGFDSPSYIAHFKNHLFLGFSSGTMLNSSIGEPLEFSTTSGAGEISFGDGITGMLSAASTSLLIFGQNRIEYLTGADTTTFELNPISDSSGAQPYTAQLMDTPMFLDDGGVRSLPTTAAFGDWRLGTVTQSIESLIRQKRDSLITPVTSMRVKAKDQYRLFWSDGTGITIYIGRKNPETLPFNLPIEVFCSCAGEVDNGRGDRLFVGCQDGYVYEMNRGTSFDGQPISSYIRLPFAAAKSPQQHTRWTKVSFEISTPDDITMGVSFEVDYARGDGGEGVDSDVDGGSPIVTTDAYADVDWTQPVQGRLEYHLSGIGPNIATTLRHSSAIAQQHTISSQTYNFSRRRLKR